MSRFFIHFLILSAILALAGYFVMNLLFPNYPVFFIFLPIIIVGTVTFLSHISLANPLKNDQRKFVRRFLIVTTFRIIGYSVFILIFIYFFSTLAKPFLIHFLILYLLYLLFEVRELSIKRSI